ncbi:MAG: hypothetical protein WKF37_05935 [Bryobacteraceae bacterium]
MTLADGTPVRLTLAEDVPLDSEPGTSIRFRVATDVLEDGKVVIAKGASAVGAVVSVEKKKKFLIVGGGMRMMVELHHVDVRGTKVPLRTALKQKTGQVSSRALESQGPKPPDIAAAKGTAFTGFVTGEQTLELP